MRRRGEWRARKRIRLENRNWKMENGKRVAARQLGVPFLFWGRKEKISTQRAQRSRRVHRGKNGREERRREEGRTERLWV